MNDSVSFRSIIQRVLHTEINKNLGGLGVLCSKLRIRKKRGWGSKPRGAFFLPFFLTRNVSPRAASRVNNHVKARISPRNAQARRREAPGRRGPNGAVISAVNHISALLTSS